MPNHVALLYSIVLEPGRRVVMSDLKAMVGGLGFREVATLIATGNLVFGADLAVAEIEDRLEAAFAKQFGKRVDILVRTATRWQALVAANPFPNESARDGSRVVVRVMRDGAPLDTAERLQRALADGERFEIVGGDLWASFPERPSASRLLAALSSRKLGVGTSRNWNTVRRLGEMLAERDPSTVLR